MLTVSEIKQRLAPIFKEYGVSSAILFGSYAKGSATPHSDVDLLVDSNLAGFAFMGLYDSA